MHIFEINIMKKIDIKTIDFRVKNPLNNLCTSFVKQSIYWDIIPMTMTNNLF